MNTAIDIKFNLEALSAQDLTRPENFTAIKQQGYSFIDNYDYSGAVNFAKKLSAKLEQYTLKEDSEWYFWKILQFWVVRLKLFSYTDLSSLEKKELVQKHILEIVNQGLDIKKIILERLRGFATAKTILEETNDLIFGLKQNQQLLGKNSQAFKPANFRPILANWLAQYIASTNTAKVKLARAGSFEITNFLSTNQYVKLLSSEEKESLKSILDFYNFLSNPIIYADAVSVPRTQMVAQKTKPGLPPPPPPPPMSKLYTPRPLEKRIMNQELRITEKSIPPTPKIAPTREDLYRSTLEELDKMREKESQPKPAPLAPAGAPKAYDDNFMERLKSDAGIPSQPFSVNDSLARGTFGDADGGSIVSGEGEIEKKLKELRGKLQK